MFDNTAIGIAKISGIIPDANKVTYSFPVYYYEVFYSQIYIGFYIVLGVMMILIMLSIIGYAVQKNGIEDKQRRSSMVEAYEADQPERIMLEYKKERWA